MRIYKVAFLLIFLIFPIFLALPVSAGERDNIIEVSLPTLENPSDWMLTYDPNNFKDSLNGEKINLKSKDELKREKVLEKYVAKRKAAKLPKGKFTINASAYTAAADECGKSDGITASGLKVKENETIACPKEFPFGTKIKIEGMGNYICQDRGGAIKGNHIDIYMKTKKEAFAFGRRNLEAEIVLDEERNLLISEIK